MSFWCFELVAQTSYAPINTLKARMSLYTVLAARSMLSSVLLTDNVTHVAIFSPPKDSCYVIASHFFVHIPNEVKR